MNTCKTCRWYVPEPDNDKERSKTTIAGNDCYIERTVIIHSSCRRHAPISARGGEYGPNAINWPHVKEYDYCGDHESTKGE